MSVKTKVSYFYLGIYTLLSAILLLAIFRYSFNWALGDDFQMADWYRSYFISKDTGLLGLVFTHNTVHPVGAEVLLTLALFRIFGINFLVPIFGSFVLLLFSQVLLSLALRKGIKNTHLYFVMAIVSLLIRFHPTQAKHLLWPFEICWFMIAFCLSLNIWLVEREGSGGKSLCLVALSCLTGSLCSAQGIILWPAVAFHLWMSKDWRTHRLMILAFGLAFLPGAVIISKLIPVEENRMAVSHLWPFLAYEVSLIGATFGIRDPNLVLSIGAIFILFVFSFGVVLFRQSALSAADRVGSVLIFTSLCMTLAFSVGRYQLGLPWVLSEFHSAPLVVPILMGLVVWAIAALDRNSGSKWFTWIAKLSLLVVCASFISSLGYAAQRVEEDRTQRSMAMHFSCTGTTSDYVLEGINRQPDNDLLHRTLPLMRSLCGGEMSERARVLIAFPKSFQDLIVANPTYEKPLHDLWEVYVTHFDLVRAFSISERSGARSLLSWQQGNANTGSLYAPEKLKQDEVFFKELKLEQ